MLPTIITVNPMRKRRSRIKNRHHSHRRHRARAHNPHRSHRRRRSRVSNPLKLAGFSLKQDLMPALIGGAGAVGVDVALAYAAPYLPAFLQSGWGRLLAQTAAAVGVGMIASKAIDKRTGSAVMAGGLVVTAYSGLRQVLAPTLGGSVKGLSGLADFADYQRSGWEGGSLTQAPALSAYMQQGAYMPQGAYMRSPRLGYMAPGSVLTGIRGKQAQLAGIGHYGSYDTEM